jgi:DNA-binding response OmpR family regulator
VRIALLEDDPSQADLYKRWLEAAGHSCAPSLRGKAFIRDIGRETYDLYILDWEVPDLSGDEVLGWICTHVENPVPVLFVTARDREEDIVHALSRGADDYMVKPLRRAELLARIEALARRDKRAKTEAQSFEVGGLYVDLQSSTILRSGEPVKLTRKDFVLAVFLLRNLGRLLSRGHILETVWGLAGEISTRTVDTCQSPARQAGIDAGIRLAPDLDLSARLPARTSG